MSSSTPGSSPDWLIDEIVTAGRENLDAGHVSRYDAKEDADAAAEVDLLVELGLTRDSVIIDLGAGTGQLSLAVAPRCSRVIAVDVSPVMLDRLRTKVAASRLTNIDVVQAGFLTYEHEGDRVDFVYSRYALHHLADFWKGVALARIRSLLEPGGVFRLWDVVYHFEPAEAADRIEEWCSTGSAEVDSEWARWELEEHVRDEHSTFTWLLEPMLERSGFAVDDAVYSGDGIFARYTLRAI